MELHVIRDLLDADVIDGNKQPLGKVDGIVFELAPRSRPRISAIQIGAPVFVRRLRQPLRGIVGWFAKKWHAEVTTIEWDKVREVGVDVEVVLQGQEPISRNWERWVAEHIIMKIPGA